MFVIARASHFLRAILEHVIRENITRGHLAQDNTHAISTLHARPRRAAVVVDVACAQNPRRA